MKKLVIGIVSAVLVIAVFFGLYALAGISFIDIVTDIKDDWLTVTIDEDEFYFNLSDKLKVRYDGEHGYQTGDILFIVAGDPVEQSYPARVKGNFILELGNIGD